MRPYAMAAPPLRLRYAPLRVLRYSLQRYSHRIYQYVRQSGLSTRVSASR